jgi:hypothetical protein
MLGSVDSLKQRRLLEKGDLVALVFKEGLQKIRVARRMLSVGGLYGMASGRGVLEQPVDHLVYKTQLILLRCSRKVLEDASPRTGTIRTCLVLDVFTEADVLQSDDVMQLSLPIEPFIIRRRILAPIISSSFAYF